MISRRTLRLLFAFLCVCALTTPNVYAANKTQPKPTGKNDTKAGQQKKEEPADEFVIKFDRAEKAKYKNYEAFVVYGAKTLDGKKVELPIANKDPKSNKYDPNEKLSLETQNFKPGDYMRVVVKKRDKESYLTKLDKYDFKAGEELPGVFRFVEYATRDEKGQAYSTVQLLKVGVYVDTMVLMKSEKGKMTTDAALAEKSGKFKKDDLVEVEVQSGGKMPMLTSIDIYKTPEAAKLKKVGESEVDGTAKYPTIELDQYGKDLSFPISGKMQGKKLVADQRIVQQAKSIKPGSDVLVRTAEDNGKTWIREIHAAPKTAGKAELKDKTMEKENDKDKGKEKTADAQ